ncbi:MAG: exo-alpha-sialidase [Sulfuricella sp.]|nr:exo-alpha-sialidase [Sulfuricella sp.]
MKKLATFLLLCATALPAVAADAPAKPHDMGKMWADMLEKAPALAVSAAFDGEGRLWLARVSGKALSISRSDDGGKTFGTPVRVNPEAENIAADGENRPKLAFGKQGEIYVSYTQSLDKPFSGNIRFARSSDGGKSFSVPLTVNDNREVISHRFDALKVDPRGRIVIAWLDKRDASAAAAQGGKYTGAALYYAVSEDGGASFAANRQAAAHSCECCRVALALDKDGTPVALWRHVYGKNVRDHALLRLDGKSEAQRASSDGWEIDACPHHGPALSISSDGVYHLTWFSNAAQHHGVFYARSTDGGKSFSAPLPIGNYDAQAGHADVLSQGKDVYIVWKEFDGENGVAYLMTSRNGGVDWSAPKMLATSADNSDHPLLVGDGKRVYLAWNRLKEGFRLIEVQSQ